MSFREGSDVCLGIGFEMFIKNEKGADSTTFPTGFSLAAPKQFVVALKLPNFLAFNSTSCVQSW